MTTAMRVWLPAVPLLALLIGLSILGRGPSAEPDLRAQGDLADVTLAEATLRADVLEARAGLLRDYDPLNDAMAALESAASRLRADARLQPQAETLPDILVARAAADGRALEQFKTDNARLQNSLAYFDLLDTNLIAMRIDPALTGAIAALGNAVLHLIEQPSDDVRRDVDDRIASLALLDAARGPDAAAADDLRLLLAHGRLLSDLIPDVDRDVRALSAISTDDLRAAIARSGEARRAGEQMRSAGFRAVLYGVFVLLLLVLARAVNAWRTGRQVSRARARVERVISAASRRLLSVAPDAEQAALERTLASFGEGFGADRAYLLLQGGSPSLRPWQRDGVGWPPGWPQAVLAPALAAPAGDDLLDGTAIDRLPAPLGLVQRAAGNAAWCGVLLHQDGRRIGVLGFDRFRADAAWPVGGLGLVRMAADVVSAALQRRHAARERLDLEARLGRARRLEVVGAFASGIAHNVNNVVAAVMGHAEMAGETAAPGSSTAYHLREIRRACERAQELTAGILQFGARRTATRRAVPLRRFLDDTISMLEGLIPPHVALVHEIDVPECALRADAANLQQVIVNLVRNAVQAIDGEGRVTLRATIETVAATRPRPQDTPAPGMHVRVSVIDNGRGMSAATLQRVFEPFFTSRPGGTGLGLATAREVVHDHGGAMDVVSTKGIGTRFTLWLPIGDLMHGTQRRHGNGETVLLISADRVRRLQEEEVVAALGYEPIGIGEIAGAASLAGRGIVAVLLDPPAGAAPGDAVRALRVVLPDVPVVLVMTVLPATGIAALATLRVVTALPRPVRSGSLADALSLCFADAA